MGSTDDPNLPRVSYDEDTDDSHEEGTQTETFLYQTDVLLQRRGKRRLPALVVVGGIQSVGRVYPCRTGNVIGRAIGTDIQLAEQGVSRRHAKLTVLPGDCVLVEDLESSNGIYFEGVRVRQRVLKERETIQLGDAFLTLLYLDEVDPEEAKPDLVDAATHLPNRRHLVEQLESAFQYAIDYRAPLAVCLVDLLEHHAIEDEHGETAIAYLLRKIGRSAADLVRVDDAVVGRFDTATLALILPDVSRERACVCGEWIRRSVEAATFVFEHRELAARVTVGVAAIPEDRVTSSGALLEYARRQLWRALLRGGSCVEPAPAGTSATHTA